MVALGPRVGGAHVRVNLKFDNRSVDLVGGQIHRQLANIGDRNRRVYQQIGRDTVVAWRTALGAITTSAPLIGSAMSGIAGAATMLAGAMRETVVASGGLIGIAGSVGFAMMTMSFGFNHVIDAIKEIDPKKLEQQLAAMTPPAREFTLAMRDLMKTLQQEVQPRIFAGLLTEMEALRSDFIPVVTNGFLGMADALNGLMKEMVQYATSKDGLATINTALQGSVTIFEHLSKAVVPFLDGFLKFHNALIPASIRLSDRIADIAERFQSWASAPGFAERIDDRMKTAEKTAGLLFKVLGNLGSAIGNIFTAINPQTNTFLEMLVDVTARFKEWSSSVEGSQSLQTWASAAIDVMAAFGRAISSVFKVLTELADPRVIISFLDTLKTAFDHLNKLPLAAIVSGFATLAEILQPISGIFLAIIIAGASFNILIGTMVGQVAGLFSMFARFTGVADKVKTSFASFGYAGKHVGKTTSAFKGLLGMVGRLAKFAGPVGLIIWAGTLIAKSDDLKAKLGDVWDAFKGVFSALGGAFSEISTALAPVVSGLSPVFDILDKIATLAIGVVLDHIAQAFRTLAGVISGIGSILAGFINAVVGLFTLDFGKVWDGLQQIGSGIGTVFQAIWDQLVILPSMLLQLGVDAFQALWGGIQSAIPVILAGIDAFIMGVVDFFVNLPSTLWDLAVSAFTGILDAIVTHSPGILEKVHELVMGIIEFWVTLPLKLLTLAMNAFASVLEAIAEYGPRIIIQAGIIVANVIDFFDKLPGRLLELATAAFLHVVEAVRTNAPKIISKAEEIVTNVIDFFESLPGKLLELATSAFLHVVEAIRGAAPTVKESAESVANSVLDAIGALPGKLLGIGAEMISELAKGILGELQSVKDAASRIVGAVTAFFPGSPVKEGPLKAWNYGNDASGAGRTLVDHIAKGLTNISPITKAMNDVSSAIAGASLPRRAVGDNASGALATATATSTPTTARLDPRDIELLADRISRSVERGAYRGVSEIGRGLALSGGRY